MSAESTHAHAEGAHDDHNSMSKGRIWKVFGILLFITIIEFVVALGVAPHYPHALWINPIYIVLTLVKAFYIVAFFMHLKFEKIGMIVAVIVPVLFIIGLILVLTNESHYWINLRIGLGL